MRSSKLLTGAAILAIALIGGCGSDGEEETAPHAPQESGRTQTRLGPNALACKSGTSSLGIVTVSGVSCADAREVALEWTHAAGCAPATGASRSACTLAGFRCLATAAGRGTSVSCSAPGRSVSFLVRT